MQCAHVRNACRRCSSHACPTPSAAVAPPASAYKTRRLLRQDWSRLSTLGVSLHHRSCCLAPARLMSCQPPHVPLPKKPQSHPPPLLQARRAAARRAASARLRHAAGSSATARPCGPPGRPRRSWSTRQCVTSHLAPGRW
eukprot:24106-Chlamydomonas_euryale.AAC.5